MTNTSSATFHQFQQQLLGRVSLHITFSHHMFIYQAFHFHFEHVSFSMFHIVRSSPNRHITTWIQLSPDTSIIFIFHISMCHRYELVRCIYPGHIYWPLTYQCLCFVDLCVFLVCRFVLSFLFMYVIFLILYVNFYFRFINFLINFF